MEIILKRIAKKADYTIGRIYIAHEGGEAPPENEFGEYVCDSLEPPVSRKIRHPSIPPGHYHVLITKSPKFGKWLPLLLDVPGRTGIRIHAGNKPADTQGCILPGFNKVVGRVIDSTRALTLLMRRMERAFDRGETVHIEII